MPRELHDGFGRNIDYLRISVTDKCNFRCVYCMPSEGVPARRHDELLTAEEIARFVRIAAREGITRVRLTGGEPLVSHRIVPLITELHAIPGIEDISLTTNGALLPRFAPALREAGLSRVNISLDTLDPDRFSAITRLGRVEQALAGIDAALEYGFDPVKVNTVVVRRLGQDVLELARLSIDRPVHVRFIEFMPIGGSRKAEGGNGAAGAADGAPEASVARSTGRGEEGPSGSARAIDPDRWNASDVIPSDELRERISLLARHAGLGSLEPAGDRVPYGAGPARYWAFPHAKGTVGFISAMSNHFCGSCNRLRLTADGQLRPCLFSDAELCVRDALRAEDDEAVLALYREALAHKPKQHDDIDGTQRSMSQIGG